MSRRLTVPAVAALLAALLAAVLGGGMCQGAPVRPVPPSPVPSALFTMPTRPVCEGDNAGVVDVAAVFDPGLREVSGVAASLLNDDILWMLADSGNASEVVGVSATTGESRLRITLPVPNIDFEEVALGPCPDLSGPCIFVADTGDNDAKRATLVVYAFPEPVLAPEALPGTLALDSLWVMPMSFPQAESINIEAVVVFPDASGLLLLEKTTSPTARIFVYRAPWSSTVNGFDTPPRTLEQSGTVTVPADAKKQRRITGASLHWSGTRMLLRFSGGLLEYVAADPVAFLDLQSLTPRQVLPSPPGEEQGEALTYTADGLGVFSISEAPKGESPVLHQSICTEEL